MDESAKPQDEFQNDNTQQPNDDNRHGSDTQHNPVADEFSRTDAQPDAYGTHTEEHHNNHKSHHQNNHHGETPHNHAAENYQPANSDMPTPAVPNPSSATVAVWQWLTYGLWVWTLGTLSVLISSTLAYFIANIDKSTDFSWLVYVIAAALCLLPISYLVDKTYQKNEPTTKHGFAAVILVIHAVFAFLVSVGSLITAIVTALSFAIDVDGDTATKVTVIISALLVSGLGALLFARITRPTKFARITSKFSLIVIVVAAVAIIAALAGPYVATIGSKKDRQIESGLYNVNSAIQGYASTNRKLPASLDDLTFESYYKSGETLVKKKLVTYEQKSDYTSSYGSSTLKYELCVDYKKAKGSGKVTNANIYDYSSSYLDTSSHPAGHTCYQQSAYGSSYSNPETIYNGADDLKVQSQQNDSSQN